MAEPSEIEDLLDESWGTDKRPNPRWVPKYQNNPNTLFG